MGVQGETIFSNLEKFALEGVCWVSLRSAASNPRGPFTFDISYTAPNGEDRNVEIVAGSFSEAKSHAIAIVPPDTEYRVCRVSGKGDSYDVVVCYRGVISHLERVNAVFLPPVSTGGGRDAW